MSTSAGDEEELELVMPFIVCASAGGPYEDQAFCAGYELGSLDAELARKPQSVSRTVRTDSMPQVDLLAMRYGYTLRHAQSSTEWTIIEMRRQ